MESRGGAPDKRLALILPSAFATSLAVGVVSLGMLFRIKNSFGAGPETIGWFTALWCAAYFVGCLALRPLSRVLSATASMALACAATACLLALHLAFPSLASAFVCYILCGLAIALFWPRAMGWLATGLEGTALARANGTYNIAWSVASILSPFAAGALSEASPTLPVYAGIGIYALNAAFILAASRRIRSPSIEPRAEVDRPSPQAADRSTPLRFPAWISLFAAYLLYAVFSNVFPVFAKDELGLSESSIGLFLLARASASAFAFLALGKMTSWQFKRRLIPAALLATLLLDIPFAFLSNAAWLLGGIILSGIVLAWSYSMSIFYGASGALDRDRRMSVHEAVLTAGQVVGSVAGGAAYQRLSWPAVFLSAAVIMLACLGAQVAILRKR